MKRRSFLLGALAAPALVHAGSLMPTSRGTPLRPIRRVIYISTPTHNLLDDWLFVQSEARRVTGTEMMEIGR
ncbi:MAG: hypothetical protein AAGI03_09110 [Pseudomonadota bacterium]